MNDVAFIIFGIEIKWYAIILTASMVVALVLLVYLCLLYTSPSPRDS